jgi:hypothetical protein
MEWGEGGIWYIRTKKITIINIFPTTLGWRKNKW